MNLIYIIFAVILVVSAILGRYIHSHKFKYATEGSASLLLGTGITGLVSLVYYASTHEALTPSSLRLPDSVFFQVLLPGIIFYAGFSVKKRMFFRNFATIFTFGFFGTLISASAISCAASAVLKSLDIAPGLVLQSALALGAICACSDTVAILQIMDKQAYPMLHSLVFGEGIVNDAVAIVLLSAVQNLMARHHHLSLTAIAELLLSFMSLFVSSLLLGVGVGLLSALMIRHIFAKHRDADREVMLLALLGYLSYLIADALDLSAILSVFICGVTMSHYSWHSMCPAAQALALHTFRLISGVMEMILYAYSGINIWTSALWRASDSRVHLSHALTLASVLLATMVVARISFTYSISAIASWTMTRGHDKKTTQQQQQQQHDHHQAHHHQGRRISVLDATVIMWGGLSRGAVTLALAYHEFNTPTHANQVMVLAVVLVVLVSTVVLGTITGPLMEFIMKTHKEQQRKQHQQQRRWQQQQQQQDELQDPLLPPNHEQQQEDRFPRTAAGGMNGRAHDLEIGNADAAMHIPAAAAAAAGNAHQARSYERHRSSLDAGLVCIEEDSATNCDEQQQQQQQHQLNARPIAIRGTNASRLAEAAAAAVAAAEAGDQDDWHWGRRARVLSRLPSMDETTETTREQEQEHLRRMAAAAAAAAAATANAFQQQRQQQQLPNALTFPVDPTFIHQELQRLQLSSYDGISSTTADLPYIHTPSDAEGGGGTGATSTALTRTASTGSLENSSHHHHHHNHQQQQQRTPIGGTSGDTGTRSPAVHLLSDGAVQQQQQRRDREPQWYIQQQVRLLEELSQLQQEYQQQCQQQQQQQQGSGNAATAAGSSSWHGFHRLWRQFDVKYLQPVFGGREVAKRTSTPMEFENYI